MNNDGFLDLVGTTNQAIILRFNTGAGHFPIDQAHQFRLEDFAAEQSNRLGDRLTIGRSQLGI